MAPVIKGADHKVWWLNRVQCSYTYSSLRAQGKEKEEKKREDNQLAKSVKDSTKIAVEAQHGLISQIIKDVVFSMRPRPGTENAPTAAPLASVVDTSMNVDA